MTKIQEINYGNNKEYKKFLILIPRSIARLKKIKKGDEITFLEEGGRIYLDFEKK